MLDILRPGNREGLEFAKSQRAVENWEKWRKLVVKSSVVPYRPSRLRDRWVEELRRTYQCETKQNKTKQLWTHKQNSDLLFITLVTLLLEEDRHFFQWTRKAEIRRTEPLLFQNLLLQLYCQMGFLPWEIRVAFLWESKLRQCRATQPTVHAGCFIVSIINRTLTWTTGSLTCTHM